MITKCFTFLALSIGTDASHLGASSQGSSRLLAEIDKSCPKSGEAYKEYCKCSFSKEVSKKHGLDPSQCTGNKEEASQKMEIAFAPVLTTFAETKDGSGVCSMYEAETECDVLHCDEKASITSCENNKKEFKNGYGLTCSYDCNEILNAKKTAVTTPTKKTAVTTPTKKTAVTTPTPKKTAVTTTTTTTTKTVAVVEFAITGVDLTDLDDKAQEGLKTDLAAGLSKELGVPAKKITVTLEAGSIKTKAEVETSNPEAVETKMTTGGKDLTTKLVKSSATLKKAVEAAGKSMDDIGASAPVVTTVTVYPPTTAAPKAVAAHASHSLPSLAALVLGAGLLVVAA